MTNAMTMLSDIGGICERRGVLGVADIPFAKDSPNVSLTAREFLDILKEVYFAGARFQRENDEREE